MIKFLPALFPGVEVFNFKHNIYACSSTFQVCIKTRTYLDWGLNTKMETCFKWKSNKHSEIIKYKRGKSIKFVTLHFSSGKLAQEFYTEEVLLVKVYGQLC